MSGSLFAGRYTAQIEGDFVVFLIGARFPLSQLLQARWIGNSMIAMQDELKSHSENGYLGGENFFRMLPIETLLMSYWRSFDDLERFSRDRNNIHYPAWVDFYKKVGTNSRIGIWHETYTVRANEYECIYVNMPKFGLGAGRGIQHVSLKDVSRARDRAGLDSQPETVPDFEVDYTV